MIKRYLSSLKTPITVTNNAWEKMLSITNKKNAKGFIFSAVSGGCNGLNYNLKLFNDEVQVENFLNMQRHNLKITKIQNNNIEIIIDPLTEMYLHGTTIDYIKEDIDKNIFENKFIFKPNKQLADSCGCGISFAPKE